MDRRTTWISAALAAMLALLAPALAPAPAAADQGDLIVQFRDGVGAASQRSAVAGAGAELTERIDSRGTLAVVEPNGERAQVREALQGLGRVRFAEPDHHLRPAALPNDPKLASQWALPVVGAPLAWAALIAPQPQVIAVIDSAVDGSHPDLKAKIWTNASEVPGNGIDDDGNGYADDAAGWDFFDDDADPSPDPGDDHGTHVAGIAAAEQGNRTGISGIDPSARVMPLRFIGPDGGWTSDAIRAIDYAAANGADVINASWGGGGYSRALLESITDAAIPFVAAAGNDSLDTDQSPEYPASYDAPNLIAVAATNSSGGLASYSNYGAGTVDIGAPGSSIISTVPGGYEYFWGTSMAAPHVAGALSMMLSVDPDASTAKLLETLLATGDPLSSLAAKTVTGRQLNVERAMTEVLLRGQPAPEPAPKPQPVSPPPSPAPPPVSPAPAPAPVSPAPAPGAGGGPTQDADPVPVAEPVLGTDLSSRPRIGRRARLRVPCEVSDGSIDSCKVEVLVWRSHKDCRSNGRCTRVRERVRIGRGKVAQDSESGRPLLVVSLRLNRYGRRALERRGKRGLPVQVRLRANSGDELLRAKQPARLRARA